MDVASLLVLSQKALSSIEEALVEVDERVILATLQLIHAVDKLVHDGLVVDGLLHDILAVSTHEKEILEAVSARLLLLLTIFSVVWVDLFLELAQVVAISLVFRNITHESHKLHLRLKLGDALRPIKIRVAVGCHGGSSQNARLIKLLFQDATKLLLDNPEGLILRVALIQQLFVLIEEVVDRMASLVSVRARLPVKVVHARHHSQLGEPVEELREDVGVSFAASLCELVSVHATHGAGEGLWVERFKLGYRRVCEWRNWLV